MAPASSTRDTIEASIWRNRILPILECQLWIRTYSQRKVANLHVVLTAMDRPCRISEEVLSATRCVLKLHPFREFCSAFQYVRSPSITSTDSNVGQHSQEAGWCLRQSHQPIVEKSNMPLHRRWWEWCRCFWREYVDCDRIWRLSQRAC